jgi:hypothetical protein
LVRAWCAAAGIVQLIALRLSCRRAIAIALALTPASLFLIRATLMFQSMAGLKVGVVMAGVAPGLGWMRCAELSNRVAPSDILASSLSRLQVFAYASAIAPVVLTGIAADAFGLPRALLLLSLALSVLAMILFVYNNASARLERAPSSLSTRFVPGR